ncbi:MAG: hypothetical protein KA059_04290 [Elusimicrobiales bacterium]|jgi:hypothetical protein|nr:hypothetical protein [Elusimicrobiales bacterium]
MKKKTIVYLSILSMLFVGSIADSLYALELNTTKKTVTLSGYLNLSGTAHVPPNSINVTTYVTGWVSLRDSSGNYHTNNTYINTNVSFWINGNSYVSSIAYPNVYVTVYDKNGKSVGSGYINQGITVGGWLNGTYLNVSGSGNISVTVNVTE